MVSPVKLIGVVAVFIGMLWLVSIASSHPATPAQNSIQQVYSDITFPQTGDQLLFYKQQGQQIIANAAQMSPLPDAALKILGYDAHNDVIAQNTTTGSVINATAGTTQANQIIAMANTTSQSNAGSYLTIHGESFNPDSGATLTNPTTTEQCMVGNICPIGGKVVMADPNSCHMQTVNGQQQNVCAYINGPFHFMLQLVCVDSNVYRCSYLNGTSKLPVDGQGLTAETNADGTWHYDWTVCGDQYCVGNYIARMTFVSETAGSNGLLVTQTGDYPLTVLQ